MIADFDSLSEFYVNYEVVGLKEGNDKCLLKLLSDLERGAYWKSTDISKGLYFEALIELKRRYVLN